MSWLARRALTLLLMPLSIVPVIAVLPNISASHDRLQRLEDSAALPAPGARLSQAQIAALRPVRPFADAVPVLVYHGINDHRDGTSVSQARFAEQMETLDRLGYETISIGDYVRWRRGEAVALPQRPLLLTFDDGRLDSFRGADAVLARHGMRATMFVITGEIERRNPFYLSWRELDGMARSGRWDVQPHAHNGHRQISASAEGDSAPFYAVRWYTRSGGLEPLAHYERRVTRDVLSAVDALARHGFAAVAFSVPFGDHQGANDPRTLPLLRAFLGRQFGVTFVPDDDGEPGYTRPGRRPAERLEIGAATSVEQLHTWLVRHHPDHSDKRRR